jgi:hypothetical protein
MSCRYNEHLHCALTEITIRPQVRGPLADAGEGARDNSDTFCASYEPH